MDDFVFGTLATDELRQAHVRALRDGVTHRSARLPRDPLPGEPVEVNLSVGPAHPCDRAWVYWTVDGSQPLGSLGQALNGFATLMQSLSPEWDTLVWGYVHRFRAILPGQPPGTVLRYRLEAGAPDGTQIPADGGASYAVYIDHDPLPDWAKDALIYQILVDRFHPGLGRNWQRPQSLAGFFGGTLGGVTANLDYIVALGANTLWLTPIFPSPSHHGYDSTDLFEVEPRLGTKDDLRALLDQAHARNVRVLLDFAANHWSNRHPTFQAAQADPHSPYLPWYNFTHWPERYKSFFGVKSLPQVNLLHPPARQHMLDAAAYWLEFGVDGYRLDYAIGPAPDFWADFRRVTRQARPDCWTFGEVVEPSGSQIAFHGLLDGCLDFVLLEALRQTFAFDHWEASRFASFLDRHEAFFPPDFSRPSFLDNHDMNRFLWAVQGDRQRLKIAALCQFTLAGPPVIYYGTEVGLSQERDVRQGKRGLPEEARLPMLWGEAQDGELLAFYQALAALRRQEWCLRRGDRQSLHVDASVLGYVRSAAGRQLAILINLSQATKEIDLPGSWRKQIFATQQGCYLEAGSDRSRQHLPPLAGAILEGGLPLGSGLPR